MPTLFIYFTFYLLLDKKYIGKQIVDVEIVHNGMTETFWLFCNNISYIYKIFIEILNLIYAVVQYYYNLYLPIIFF